MRRKPSALSGRQHGAVGIMLAAATVGTLGEWVGTHERVDA
jgi:hypothetical protein